MWFLPACNPDPAVEQRDTARLAIPTFATEAAAPEWSAEEAASAIELALVAPFPSPFVIRDTLIGWFGYGDQRCPGTGTWMAGNSFEGCTSDDGWYYLGVGGFTELPIEDEHGFGIGMTIMGDFTVIAPDGAVIDVGGHWIPTLHEGPAWHGILNGSWHEPGHEVDWLAQGMSAWLTFASVAEGESIAASLDGGLTLRGTTLGFRDVYLGLAACEGVPTGVVEVLDPGGGWWSFDFGDACEPCAAVRLDGADVETEACLSLPDLAADITAAFTP